MRLVWIFVGLTALLLIPFALWGEARMFTPDGAVAWLRGYGRWAWAAGLALLIADLFLPIPGTAVMAALGFIYGPLLGGFLGAGGSFLSGAAAYLICRALGIRAAGRLVGAEDLRKGEQLFARYGAWLVVWSRWLPLFPEVIACMAGLTRMPPALFFLALACGSIPLGIIYAAIGHAGVEHPAMALLVSALLPPALWLLIHHLFLQRMVGREGSR